MSRWFTPPPPEYPHGVLSGACDPTSWACTSGQCIESTRICDGRVDCFDRSDETATLCSSHTCPRYAFRCAYGACIPGQAKCDGVSDCADSSDEATPTCRPSAGVSDIISISVSSSAMITFHLMHDGIRCPSEFLLDDSTNVNCEYYRISIPCSALIGMRANTLARFTCRNGYRRPPGQVHDLLLCEARGSWNGTRMICEPADVEMTSWSDIADIRR